MLSTCFSSRTSARRATIHMTVVCGGGDSESIPGYPQVVAFTAAAIESSLTFLSEGAALILAPAIAGLAVDLSLMCASDPPADPGLTATDLFNLLPSAGILANGLAVAKVRQWFLSWYWYKVCRCKTVTTPAAPTPSDPGDVAGTNPGLPGGGVSGACWTGSESENVGPSTSAGHGPTVTFFDALPPFPPVSVTPGLTVAPSTAIPIPPGATSVSLSVGYAGTLPGPTVRLDTYDGSGSRNTAGFEVDIQSGGFGASGVIPNGPLTLPSGTASVAVYAFPYWASSTTFQAGVYSISCSVTFTCPSTVTQPCCPPDPSVDLRLSQILDLVQQLYLSTPTSPSSFAESTVHAGLTSSGSFSIGTGTIALKVELTTIGNAVSVLVGNPDTYLGAGTITTSAAEGNYSSHRIRHSPEVFLLGDLVDAVHYTLGDVVATITELTAGP